MTYRDDAGGTLKIEDVIGANIADARERAGMTQATLGKALGEYLGADWSRQAVWAAERGRRAFTATELLAFARVLHTTLSHLFTPAVTATVIEMPTGATVSRTDLFEATLPDDEKREIAHDMRQALADLAEENARQHDVIATLAVQLDQLRGGESERH